MSLAAPPPLCRHPFRLLISGTRNLRSCVHLDSRCTVSSGRIVRAHHPPIDLDAPAVASPSAVSARGAATSSYCRDAVRVVTASACVDAAAALADQSARRPPPAFLQWA